MSCASTGLPSRYFDGEARSWDAAHGPESPRRREYAARRAYLRARCRALGRPRVLDLGCGTGRMLIDLTDLIEAGLGVDIAPAMIAHARSLAAGRPGLRFLTSDAAAAARDVPGRYDLAFFIGSLEHMPDPAAALGAARRALTRGGHLIVIMPHPGSPLLRLARLTSGRAPVPTRHFSPGALAHLATRAGLAPAGMRPLPFSPWPGRLPAPIWGPAWLQGAYAAEFTASTL